MRHRSVILTATALTWLLGGCGSGSAGAGTTRAAPDTTAQPASAPGAGAPGAVTVAIRDFSYSPAALTVKAGTKVTWANFDSAPHDARSPGAFATPTLTKGQSRTVTLSTPGTYTYVCSFHPFMKATVTVR